MANQKNQPSLGGVPIVTLHVGRPATTFHIHRSLLCGASPVFHAAFLEKGTFQESETQAIDLTEDDAAVFEVITPWLYTGLCELSEVSPDFTGFIARLATFSNWVRIHEALIISFVLFLS